jgi:glycerol kinase
VKTLVAIDQSTSATKAVLLGEQGEVLDRASREHRQIYPQPGWVEHDAEEIWRNVLETIREIAGRNESRLHSVAGLSLTNQRETIVVFERGTGRPLHNAIVWQCRRGEPICQRLREAGTEELVRAKTGLVLDTYFSGSKLKWLADNVPGLDEKMRRGEALIGTIETYLIYRLTGGAVFATDHTNASRTLLFGIQRLRWDQELCALFDVPIQALAEVRESAGQFGETDAEGALPRLIPICGVMGDSQAALFAQRCFAPGMVKATFGTGTSILLNIGQRFQTPGRGVVLALGWVWRGQPTYALEGIINCSAATITWLTDQMKLIRGVDEIEGLVRSVPDNGGVYFVPAFAGLGAPHWAPQARAAIVGLTAFSRREHIVRAAEEAIAYQIFDALDLMQGNGAPRLTLLRADGGPTRDSFLMQFTADITGLELEVSETAETSAWGVAMMGLLGLGLRHSLEELAAMPRQGRSYRPAMDATKVGELRSGWRLAVKRVL